MKITFQFSCAVWAVFMSKRNSVKYILVLLSVVMLTSCESVADSAHDCINNDSPTFDLSSWPNAILNEEYSVLITASIKNNPNDSSYNYSFKLEGDIPNGIELITELGSRYARISGTPTELGRYRVKLKVIVTEQRSYLGYEQSKESYDDGDDLCSNAYDKVYILDVAIH